MSVSIGSAKTVELPPRVFCGRLIGFLFDSEKCFLLPGALSGVKEVKIFYDQHPGLTVMISGHADRAGADDYNLTLSTERAKAIEAFLLDKVDEWMPWYGAGKPAQKRWGVLEDQHMLTALGYYSGPVHGREDEPTRQAVNRLRGEAGLGDGKLDDATRRKLVEKYMKIDDTTLPAGTKVEHHGCGEHHPIVQTADGVAESENRRVEVYFFEGPVEPAAPATCPSGGCTAYPEWKKKVIETIDLRVRRDLVAITVALRNRAAELIKDAPYHMKSGDRTCNGRTANGLATLLVPLSADRCLVKWGREFDEEISEDCEDCSFKMELYLHYDVGSEEEQAKMRLHNLGFLDTLPLDQAISGFQEEYALEVTGKLDDKTKQKLLDVHGELAKPVAPGVSRG